MPSYYNEELSPQVRELMHEQEQVMERIADRLGMFFLYYTGVENEPS